MPFGTHEVDFLKNSNNETTDLRGLYGSEGRSLGEGAVLYKGSNGRYVANGDTVPAGATHLTVLVGGAPTNVRVPLSVGGLVADLTETSATLGGTSVTLHPFKNGGYQATDAQLQVIIPLLGEQWFNTTDNSIHVGDGVTPGGIKQSNAVNVKHFGAKGDGIADDTAALLAAIAAIPESGGTVYLPAGVYKYTQTLTLEKGITICGEGDTEDETSVRRGSTLLKYADILGVELGFSCSLRDLIVLGNSGTSGDGIKLLGNSSSLTRVFSSLHGGDGVNIGGDGTAIGSANCNNWHMDSVTSRSNGGRGFTFLGYDDGSGPDVNNGLAVHCTAEYNGSDGFHISHATVNTFVQCYAEGNIGKGFDLSDQCQNSTFVNCGSEGNDGNDVDGQFTLSGATAFNNFVQGSYLYSIHDPNNIAVSLKATGGTTASMNLSRRVGVGGGFNPNYGVTNGIHAQGGVPGMVITEDTAALDRKTLSILNNAGNTFFRFYDDDGLGSNDWFRTNREADGSVSASTFTGDMRFTGILGVGNYQADSGPVGTLIGKFYITDEAGAGIGFVPVYQSI